MSIKKSSLILAFGLFFIFIFVLFASSQQGFLSLTGSVAGGVKGTGTELPLLGIGLFVIIIIIIIVGIIQLKKSN